MGSTRNGSRHRRTKFRYRSEQAVLRRHRQQHRVRINHDNARNRTMLCFGLIVDQHITITALPIDPDKCHRYDEKKKQKNDDDDDDDAETVLPG